MLLVGLCVGYKASSIQLHSHLNVVELEYNVIRDESPVIVSISSASILPYSVVNLLGSQSNFVSLKKNV